MPRIQLLGEVGLHLDAKPIQLRSTKELGLLAILAEAHPRPITRGYLLDLLWPASDPDRARRSLNQAVYAIRQVVGQDALRAHLDLLALDGPDWTCDLWDLDDLVAEAADTRTPLPRFARSGRLPNTDGFRDWLDRTNARVDAHLVSAYCAALEKLMERGRFEAVEPIARAVLEIDRYAETGLYHLALSIANSGRITAAIQEIADARERFATDLDRDLPSAFDALQERLESAEAFEASRRPLVPGDDPVVFPFVGREEEFARLRSAWDHIGETGRRIVLVSGEPGIGKTRLVDRLARLASISGGRVLHTECFAAHKRVAFAAISEALRGLRPEELAGLDTIWRRVLFSSLALEAAGTALEPPPRLDPAAEQLRLFEAATLAIQASAAKRPVLLVVDDLQWLDQSSAAVLQHVIRRCEEDPVLFVFAARERELRVDDELREFVANNRGGHFLDINVGLLEEGPSHDLIRTALRDAPFSDDRSASTIYDKLGRHPFLITAMLRSRASITELERGGRGTPPGDLPPSVNEYFSTLFARVSPKAVELASTLSIWGDTPTLETLVHFFGSDDQHTLAQAEELERHGVIDFSGSRVRLKHGLYKDWLSAQIPQPRRLTLHAKIASHLSTHVSNNLPAIAAHYHSAGLSPQAYVYALRAADELIRRGALEEAEHFIGIAVNHANSEERRLRAESRLAAHLVRYSSYAKAKPLLAALVQVSSSTAAGRRAVATARALDIQIKVAERTPTSGDLLRQARDTIRYAIANDEVPAAVAALSAATRCLWQHGSIGDGSYELTLGQQLLPQAMKCSVDVAMDCHRTLINLALIGGDHALAQRIYAKATRESKGRINARLAASFQEVEGFLKWMTGDLQSAASAWSQALSAARQSGQLTFIVTNDTNLAVARHYRHKDVDVDPDLCRTLNEARVRGLGPEVEVLTANRALFAWENRKYPQAAALVRESEGNTTLRNAGAGSVIFAVRGLLAYRQGRADEADRELRAAQEALGSGGGRVQDPSIVLQLARHLCHSEDDLLRVGDLGARMREESPLSRICSWKIDLELAQVKAELGDVLPASELVCAVIEASRKGGAERILSEALTSRARLADRVTDGTVEPERASVLDTNLHESDLEDVSK